MRRTPLEQTGTAALYFGLVLSHFVGEGGIVRVLSRPGQPVTLPCSYHYEDRSQLSQLSVQWRSPDNELLCHFIKHKAFQRCSAGYAIAYSPGNITLTIHSARPQDLGAHVCSVSKRDEFSDCSVELATMSDSVTSAPNGGRRQSGTITGPSWTHFLLTLGSFVIL